MEKAGDTREETPEVSRIVETALFVEDLPRACDFYQQVLRLEKVEGSDTGCVLRVGDLRYLLVVSRESAQAQNKTATGDLIPPCALPQHDGRGPGHIAFGVSADALDSWRARLAKHSVQILSVVTSERGARSRYFRDPDDHMIELATPGIWESA